MDHTAATHQLQLWAPDSVNAPPANHTRTSQAAADSIAPHAGTLRGRVLEHLRDLGDHGATIDELAADLDMLTATVCGRISELRRAGQIFDSGRTRETRSGRKAIVWVATGGTS